MNNEWFAEMLLLEKMVDWLEKLVWCRMTHTGSQDDTWRTSGAHIINHHKLYLSINKMEEPAYSDQLENSFSWNLLFLYIFIYINKARCPPSPLLLVVLNRINHQKVAFLKIRKPKHLLARSNQNWEWRCALRALQN